MRRALPPAGGGEPGDAAFAAALRAIEASDADGDGESNGDEIRGGSAPGDPASRSAAGARECPGDAGGLAYRVCQYDPPYVYRKVMLDFCGRSPSFEERQAFGARAGAAQRAALHEALDGCLKTPFWRGRDGAVWRLAHPKVRPASFGENDYGDEGGAGGEGGGGALYDDDYALFVYTQIDGHDARDLLLARYFVRQTGPTDYARVDELPGQQNIPAERRAGMITTAWFLIFNNMFTALPRTAAAQAYRSYLGYDIAKQEGLYPVSDEPVDYDDKGLRAPTCAVCHSTLDPLTYPFRNYDGVSADDLERFGRYLPDRLESLYEGAIPGVSLTPEAGYLFGQPVADLTAWARAAADSDAFAIALVRDYWQLLLGAPPAPDEAAAFEGLWRSFRGPRGYSVEGMLHDLIDTEVYGVP
ncbi:MAG TPA: hypothetical protein VFS43_01155 [Polyangiaceae bacterium]|nr:hypothetical protein [Polyangiaceae bacterium]